MPRKTRRGRKERREESFLWAQQSREPNLRINCCGGARATGKVHFHRGQLLVQFREWCLAVGANVWCVKGSNTSTGELLIVERPVQFRDRVQIVLKANCVGDRRLRFYYSSCFWSLVVSRLRDGWIRGLSLFAADIWRSYLLNSQEPGCNGTTTASSYLAATLSHTSCDVTDVSDKKLTA